MIYIGTSGFYYKHWKGLFYPEDLQKKEYLNFYSKNFKALELNITFYRLPNENTIKNWVSQTPDNFSFVCKIWRRISHLKKLNNIEDDLKYFSNLMKYFGKKLKALLLQLPPSFKFNKEKILKFKKIYDLEIPLVIEGRNKTFFESSSIDFFYQNKLSLSSIDSPNFKEKYFYTANPFYLRLHGSKSLYSSIYTKEELKKAIDFIKTNVPSDSDVFIFFNNDFNCYAIQNAKEILDMIEY